MYTNFGDKNFFEYGLYVDTEHSDEEFPILFCQPYPDEENLYQFGECTVSINDSWINRNEVMRFIGMTEKNFNPVQFAIGCFKFYGPEEFGADSLVYDWTHMERKEIEEQLKYRLIVYDES